MAGAAEAMRVVAGQIGSMTDEARNTDIAVNEMQTVAGEVGQHIGELRAVMVRVVRTSSDAADRRDSKRVIMNEQAVLLIDGQLVPAMCLDLSLGGARVRAAEPLTDGCDVTLRLAGLPDLPAQVTKDGEEAGLRFAWEPDEAPAPLVERLTQLAEAA